MSTFPSPVRYSTSSMRTPKRPGRYMPGSAEMTAPSGIGAVFSGEALGASCI